MKNHPQTNHQSNEFDNQTDDKELSSMLFYVVSLDKFLVLFISTLGLYMTYWFYKQWLCYKEATQGKEWPMMRATFSVLFVHGLFAKLTEKYEEKSGVKSTLLNRSATLFIVVAVISFVCGNVPDPRSISPYLILVNLLTIPFFCWFCFQAQWFANYVCDDIGGTRNNTYSIANYCWITLGIIWWFIYFSYIVLPAFSG